MCMKTMTEEAIKFVGKHISDPIYKEIYEYGLKVFEQFYSSNSNGLSERDLAVSIVLHNILNNGVSIEEIQEIFGDDVATVVFNTNDDADDHRLRGYEKHFKVHDLIFIKLIVRAARIHTAINNLDNHKFKKYINEYNELRRKLLKEVDDSIMVLMDYESDLIKYGRNTFAGKPARNYKYENLIINA